MQNSYTRVGFRLPDWATQMYPVIQGVWQYVRERGLHWRMMGDFAAAQELEVIKIDEAWSGEGVIVFRPTPEELAAWEAKGVKVVNISSEASHLDVHSSLPDNFHMGKLAAEHLLSFGFENFCYVGSRERVYSCERHAGFKATLLAAGFETQEINIGGEALSSSNRAKLIQLALRRPIERIQKPVAVMARDDITALAIVRCASSLGIKVPEDLAVVGVGDALLHCQMAWPPLTSVRYPAKSVGYHAARVLHQLLEEGEAEQKVQSRSSGIELRESSKVFQVSDPLIESVLVYIRTHSSGENIQISQLGDKFSVSYSFLRKRFREVVGHSIRHEINVRRIECLKAELLNSDLTLQEVAWQMRFSSVEHMARFFLRHVGQTPKRYRMSHAQPIEIA
ncbi:substrate-binding domain-containing protein [Rubritalea tangerina]|uniref:Substrate-binding domain-containing protein n=1 Tax=Rubritalea tangerina TaxID=430798 RepID=A0ABW4ZDF6_9BACT